MRDTGDGNYSKNQFDYYCPICDAGYEEGEDLLKHLDEDHEIQREDSQVFPQQPTGQCESKPATPQVNDGKELTFCGIPIKVSEALPEDSWVIIQKQYNKDKHIYEWKAIENGSDFGPPPTKLSIPSNIPDENGPENDGKEEVVKDLTSHPDNEEIIIEEQVDETLKAIADKELPMPALLSHLCPTCKKEMGWTFGKEEWRCFHCKELKPVEDKEVCEPEKKIICHNCKFHIPLEEWRYRDQKGTKTYMCPKCGENTDGPDYDYPQEVDGEPVRVRADDCDHIWIVDEKVMVNTPREKPLEEGQFLMRKICSMCTLVKYNKCISHSNKDFMDRYFSIYKELIDQHLPGKWLVRKRTDSKTKTPNTSTLELPEDAKVIEHTITEYATSQDLDFCIKFDQATAEFEDRKIKIIIIPMEDD